MKRILFETYEDFHRILREGERGLRVVAARSIVVLIMLFKTKMLMFVILMIMTLIMIVMMIIVAVIMTEEDDDNDNKDNDNVLTTEVIKTRMTVVDMMTAQRDYL